MLWQQVQAQLLAKAVDRLSAGIQDKSDEIQHILIPAVHLVEVKLARVYVKQRGYHRLTFRIIAIKRSQLEVDISSHQRRAYSRDVLGNFGVDVFFHLWFVVLGNITLSERNRQVRPSVDRDFQLVVFSVPLGSFGLEAEQIVARVLLEHVSQTALDVVIIAKELAARIHRYGVHAVLRLAEVISFVVEKVDRILVAYIIGR